MHNPLHAHLLALSHISLGSRACKHSNYVPISDPPDSTPNHNSALPSHGSASSSHDSALPSHDSASPSHDIALQLHPDPVMIQPYPIMIQLHPVTILPCPVVIQPHDHIYNSARATSMTVRCGIQNSVYTHDSACACDSAHTHDSVL